MYRATTPLFTFDFDVDPDTTFKSILVAFAQNDSVILTKEKTDMSFDSAVNDDGETTYTATIRLTQQEANKFNTKKGTKITIQLRTLTYDGEAVAFDKMTVQLKDVLDDRVLT